MPVAVEPRYASAGARLGAFLIDAVLLVFVDAWLSAFSSGRRDLALLVDAVYFIVTWSSAGGGQTVGMRALGIRVVGGDGAAPSMASAAVRFIGFVIGWIVAGLGLIWIVFDRKRQGWHDLMAGTYVVRGARSAAAAPAEARGDARAADAVASFPVCHRCGNEQSRVTTFCESCGAKLRLDASEHRFGIAYTLNQLADWESIGAIDASARARLARVLRQRLAALTEGVPAPPGPAAPSAVPAPGRASPMAPTVTSPAIDEAAPGIVLADAVRAFAVEETPSLLLYVGAFLVVVSALIFVNVSGEQISDAARFGLVLLGTIAFLIAGVALHRIPRVLPAGRTFLAIGALLVPADVFAAYALLVRRTPLDAPGLWLAGSIMAALLYAALAVAGFGRWYSPLFALALISGVGAFAAEIHASTGWSVALYAMLALAVLLLQQRAPARLEALAEPLLLVARALAAVVVVFGILAYATLDPRAVGIDRWAPFAASAAMTAFAFASGWRTLPWAGWAALGGAGGSALLAVHAFRPATEVYGLALVAVAWAYLALVIGPLATRLPELTATQSRWLCGAAAIFALLFVPAYERAPAPGALVFAGVAALAALLSVAHEVRVGLGTVETDRPLLYVALGLAHAAWRYALMAALPGFRGNDVLDLATGFFPLSVAILATAAIPASRARERALALGVSGIASAAFVTIASLGDVERHTLFAGAFAAVVAVGALRAREPLAVWIAAAFAAFASLGALRWSGAPAEWWTLSLTAVGVVAAAAAETIVVGWLRRHLAEIALAWQGFATATGFWFVVARSSRLALPIDDPVWSAAAIAMLALAVLVWLASRRSGEPLLALAASAFVVGVLLMEIARLHPRELQAFTLPLGVYLLAVALLAPRLATIATSADALELSATAVLVAPALLRSVSRDGEAHLALAVAASIALLALGVRARRPTLVRASAAAIAVSGIAAATDPDVLVAYATVGAAAALLFVWLRGAELSDSETAFLELSAVAAALVPLAAGTWLRDSAYLSGLVVATVFLFALGVRGARRYLAAAAPAGLLAALVLARPELEWRLMTGGAGVLALAIWAPRLSRGRLPRDVVTAGELVGALALLAPPFLRAFSGEVLPQGAVFIAAALLVTALAIEFERPALLTFALGAASLATIRAFADPRSLAIPSAAGGIGLLILSLSIPRGWNTRLPRHALALDAVGAAALFGPLFVRSWDRDGFAYAVVMLVAALALLAAGIVLARRNPVALALGALGLTSLHALVDVVNRLPNWALFAIAGAILLAAGVVLLLKREAWTRWQRRTLEWWEGFGAR